MECRFHAKVGQKVTGKEEKIQTTIRHDDEDSGLYISYLAAILSPTPYRITTLLPKKTTLITQAFKPHDIRLRASLSLVHVWRFANTTL
jgi:hypothetical protein